jgi:TATA-box binding protein (TBP) (component of TFIID and TFIIIB)
MVTNINNTSDILEIEYSCNPFCNKDYFIDTDEDSLKDKIDLNVNCINVYFNINFTINRQRFYEKLIQMNYICKYKPESYSGIKLLYKIPLQRIKNGLCICTTKCTCLNITFLIFQSGNVIATGFKTMEQIDKITSEFLELCDDLKSNIQKRELF